MPRFVSHLEGAIDGARLSADELQTLQQRISHPIRYLADQAEQIGKRAVVHRTVRRHLSAQPAALHVVGGER